MSYEYMIARGLLVPAGDDLLYKPPVNGKKLKEWDNKPLQDFLNHYGEQGWEAINFFSPAAGQGYCVVFKRSK